MIRFAMTRSPSPVLVLMLGVLAWTGPALAIDDSSVRWTNGMPTQDLRFNALSANPNANPRMVQVALRSESYELSPMGEPALREQLADPSARLFMRYLAQCALAPGQFLRWTDRGGNSYQFEGKLALCPEWHTGPAPLHCQRWVSACVLARNNAEGDRVLLSGRGYRPADPTVFTPKPEVRTDVFARFSHTRVASTLACSVPEYGMHRNCGFKPERVGVCSPGTRVQVGAGGTPPDHTCGGRPLGSTVSGTMMLRVCEGLHACNSGAALAKSEGTCGTALPAVSFTCPPSGTFNVLSGAYNSADSGQVAVAVEDALYPATEEQAFSLREGAFYGNIFGPDALAAGVNVYVDNQGQLHKDVDNVQVTGSIYPKMYACMAPTWSDAAAQANKRLCTMPGMNCVALPVGGCDEVLTSGPYAGQERCQVENASGYGDYSQCVGPAGDLFPQAVTSYLNQPCDVVKDQYACSTPTSPAGGAL